MKFQLFSDLHAEFEHDYVPQWDGESEYLLLAGDIHITRKIDDYTAYMNKITSQGWKKVFFIAGNHEAYGSVYQQSITDLESIAEETGATFLNNDTISLGEDIYLIGGTMWTDLSGPAGFFAEIQMNDYQRVKWYDGTDYHAMRVKNTTEMFFTFQAYLSGERERLPANAKIVVMTHTSPHAGSGALEFKGDMLNAAYFTDMSGHMSEHMPYWVHGHMHNSSNYTTEEGTTVLCNPFGYHGQGYDLRNKDFDLLGVSFIV